MRGALSAAMLLLALLLALATWLYRPPSPPELPEAAPLAFQPAWSAPAPAKRAPASGELSARLLAAPPEPLPAPEPAAPVHHLAMVLSTGSRGVAQIDGALVESGASLGAFRVALIEPDGVLLVAEDDPERVYHLPVGGVAARVPSEP